MPGVLRAQAVDVATTSASVNASARFIVAPVEGPTRDWQHFSFGSSRRVRLRNGRHPAKSLTLHRSPVLPATQELPESAQPPINGELSISDILQQRPPEKQSAIPERVVAMEAHVLEYQRERRQRRAETVGSQIEQPSERPTDGAKSEPRHETQQSNCFD